MVSTHLKNISQNGNLPQVGVNIKNIWNHHLDYSWLMSPFQQTPDSSTNVPRWFQQFQGSWQWPWPFKYHNKLLLLEGLRSDVDEANEMHHAFRFRPRRLELTDPCWAAKTWPSPLPLDSAKWDFMLTPWCMTKASNLKLQRPCDASLETSCMLFRRNGYRHQNKTCHNLQGS